MTMCRRRHEICSRCKSLLVDGNVHVLFDEDEFATLSCDKCKLIWRIIYRAAMKKWKAGIKAK